MNAADHCSASARRLGDRSLSSVRGALRGALRSMGAGGVRVSAWGLALMVGLPSVVVPVRAWAQPGAPGSVAPGSGTPAMVDAPRAGIPARVIPNLYPLQLSAALQRALVVDYQPPADRQGRMRVVLDAQGAVVQAEIVKSAGYPALDRAMEAAAARFGPGESQRLPFPTDPALAAQAVRAGVLVSLKFAGKPRPETPAAPNAAPASEAYPQLSRPVAAPSGPEGRGPASGATAPKER